MRVIVRLLLRVAILAGVAVAIVFVSGWAADARADPSAPDLGGADAPPAPQAPAAPPLPAPPTLPPAPQPPPLPAPPTLPSAPDVPDLAPGLTLPATPGLPGDPPPPPAPPAAPDAPAVDLTPITNALGTLPAVPAVTPPEGPELPALPELPVEQLPSESPGPTAPAPGPIEIGVVSDARTAAANPNGLATTVPAPEPLNASDSVRFAVSDSFTGFDRDSAPARAPPLPASVHSCPGGGGSSSGRTAPAGLVPPGADDATRRASMLFGSRAYASSSDFDPLLRPD